MKLSELIQALTRYEVRGDGDIDIRAIELDSRRVGGGGLFVCLEGLARNGHDFAAAAVAQGAAALVVRHFLPEVSETTQVVVPDPREAMARLAAAFFSHPSRDLDVIGVTGTNGKTTVTHLVQAVGREAGRKTSVVGTLGSTVGGDYRETGFTTPEAPELQKLLRQAADADTEWVALEVSSHALAQKRSFATDFRAVVFTNLTRDHLDYHQDMQRYFETKARLFTPEGRGSDRGALAVINLEDRAGRALAEMTAGARVTYGFGKGVDYRARHVRLDARKTRYELVTPVGRSEVRLRLLGRFNVLNALAAQAVSVELGAPLEAAARGVSALTRVPGRMESVSGTQPFLVLVDYSHTPDALEHALRSARRVTRNRLLVVFGCGGDRDPGKREEMGRVSARLADRVVVTSDNPRHEDPESIIESVVAGTRDGSALVHREVDRARAIRFALECATEGDTVLVAGKGHEPYQIVGDRRLPFDDRRVAAATLREIGFDADDPEPGL
jgi:UDP-N-acetylmuramoyl-L-alanyl-D-glutamate--2,6-diaminopimelate ligase